MPHRDPLAIFFKLPPDASPVAVLGVHAGLVSDDDIIAARARRLALVDEHPLSGTPDADEARLAVHTSAARLLQQSAMHRGNPASPAARPGSLPTPQPRLGVPQAAAALDRETLLLVGLAGGWSPRVLTRLAAIAITRGLGTKDAVAAAMRLASKPTGSATARPAHPRRVPPRRRPNTPPTQPVYRPVQGSDDPVMSDETVLENWMKTTLVIAGSVGVTLTILIFGAVWALNTLKAEPKSPSPDQAQATTPAPGATDRIAPPRAEVNNADLVLYELSAAKALERTKRSLQAVNRIDAALGHWLEQWPSHPPESWRAVLEQLAPLIDSLRTDATGDAALATMFARLSPDPTRPLESTDVPRQVALAAVLGSLDAESPSKALTTLTQTWHARSPYTVPTGDTPAAKEALRAITKGHLARTAAASTAWASSAAAISAVLAENPEPLLLVGATDLLGSIEPPNAGESEAIQSMIGRLDWRSGSTARAWLLARLNDRTVHPVRIATAINTLTQSTSAPGVPTSLKLGPNATWDDRYSVSQTLADAWGLRVSLNRDLLINDWLERADQMLGAPPPSSDAQIISTLGDLAYLNTAAALSLFGESETAISNLSRSSSRPSQLPPLTPLFRNVSDSPLTLAAASGDRDRLVQRLGEINEFNIKLSQADATTLVELAFRERNEVVRNAAVDAVRPIAALPEIILAALETSPLIADTAPNRSLLTLIASDSVEPAPGQEWVDSVHLALARSLLSRTDSASATIDNTARRVGEAYASTGSFTRVNRQAPLSDHVRALTNAQLARVHPDLGTRPVATPAQIVSLRDTRLRVATSPVQRFAIELQALAGATLLAATSNNSSLEQPARTLWAQLLERRENADSALAQALATERLLARLHAIIMTTQPGSSPSPRRSEARAKVGRTPPHAATQPDGLPAATPPGHTDLAARLERLSVDEPAAYLDVADELIMGGRENLAVHTLVVAVFLAADRGDTQTASSACLALATLTPDSAQREQLRALAGTLNPRLNRPAWIDPSGSRTDRAAAHLKAARVLLNLRRGRGEQALALLGDDEIREALSQQPELSTAAANRNTSTLPMLSGLARQWPCPECQNERTVRPRGQTEPRICPRCQGNPGPVLSEPEQIAWLAAEVRLLAPQEPWSSALLIPGHNAPVAEPSLGIVPTFFRVDPSLSLYRNGRWVRP